MRSSDAVLLLSGKEVSCFECFLLCETLIFQKLSARGF